MTSAPYLLGIDLGTTTCRCAIFDLNGFEVAAAYEEMPIDYPQPLWAEIDPEVWWRGTVRVIRAALRNSGLAPEQIAGVGLSGLMHAPVLLDGDGQPVTSAMLWMDQRCAPQCEAMNQEWPADEAAPFRFSTSATAPKLRWLADNRPDVWDRARTLLLPKDFARYRLTNEICTDFSDAGGTGLLDWKRGVWHEETIRLAHASPEILPPLRPSEALAGRVTATAARETGLAAGTPVAVGGGDTLCTRMGIGELAAGEVCIYLGTAAWIAIVDGVGPDARPAMHFFGSTATTGAALRWVRDLLAGEANTDVTASYERVTRQAQDVPAGAEGLFFLPHLMGERGPEPDPLARGALIGLTLRHRQPQLIRAVLEGTAFHLRRVLEARAGSYWPDGGPKLGVACGGVARSPFWMQLLADITQLPLRVPVIVEAGALGAAICGGIAAGVLSVETASAQMVRLGPIYHPNPVLAARYDTLYARYCRLDDLLAPWFREAGWGEA